MVQVGRGIQRVLRDDGCLWLNLGDSFASQGGSASIEQKVASGAGTGNSLKIPVPQRKPPAGLKAKDLCGIPWRVAFALQADGWYLRMDNVWAKGNPMPEPVTDRPVKSHEYVFMLTKEQRYWYDAEAIKEGLSDATLKDLASRQKPGCHDGDTKQFGKMAGLGAGPRVKGQTRHKLSVWQINTTGFPGGHFAVFPVELARTCILASCPPKVCAECGKPWERIVQRGNSKHHCRPGCGCGADQKHGKQNWDDGWEQYGNYTDTSIPTDEFEPKCKCDAETIPGTVLDPFSGAGTCGVVCRDLGLNYIGIELNPSYANMSRQRIADPFYETKLRQHQRVERENKEQIGLFDDEG